MFVSGRITLNFVPRDFCKPGKSPRALRYGSPTCLVNKNVHKKCGSARITLLLGCSWRARDPSELQRLILNWRPYICEAGPFYRFSHEDHLYKSWNWTGTNQTPCNLLKKEWVLIKHQKLAAPWIYNSWFSCDVIILQKKKKQINPCEVLVLSYASPSKNLTFCNVWARQGSSLCNRVRLNFPVCAYSE